MKNQSSYSPIRGKAWITSKSYFSKSMLGQAHLRGPLISKNNSEGTGFRLLVVSKRAYA